MTTKIVLEKSDIPISNNSSTCAPSPWSKVANTALDQLAKNREIEPIVPPPVPDFEEIAKHSVLDSHPEFKEAPSPKLFALMHGDPIGKSTKWEGGNTRSNIEYLEKYLNFYVNKNGLDQTTRTKIQAILELIEKSLKVGEDPKAIMKAIADLKEGESFLMVGGYGGRPGHALLYKFTRRANGNYDLFIYNTGEGLDFHFKKGVEHRDRYHPVEVIEDLLPEAFCLSSDPSKCKPNLFARLIELSKWNDPSLRLHSDDIYQKVFGHLAAKRRTVLGSDSDLTGEMRSGMCSWKVLTSALMRYELGDIEAYKSFVASEKYDSTRAFYPSIRSTLEEDSQDGDEQRVILRNSLSSQLHRLPKQLNNPESLTRYCTLSDLKMRIDEIESKIRMQRLKNTRSIEWNPQKVQQNYSKLIDQTGEHLTRFKVSAEEVYTRYPALPVALTAQNFSTVLSNVSTQLDNQKTLDVSKQALIESTTDLFPEMDDAFWDQIPKETLHGCTASLLNLLTSYVKVVNRPHGIHAQQQNCALALFAALHKISLRISDYGELNSYGIHIQPFIDQIERERYFLFYEPQAFKRQMKLLDYFKKQGSFKPTIFKFDDYSKISEETISRLPEIKLLSYLAKSDDSTERRFSEKLKINIETFKKAPHSVVNAGTLLSCPELFRGSSHEYIYFLMYGAIALQMFAGYQPSDNHRDNPISIKLSSHYLDGTCLTVDHLCKDKLSIDSAPIQTRASVLHREKEKNDLKRIIESRYLSRAPSDLKPEADTLIEFKKEGKIDWDKLLACVNCEPALQPAKVLHYFRDHYSELTQPDSQTLFDLLFYKPYSKGVSWFVPLFNELESSSLVKQIDDFIKQGLNLYYEKQPGAKPDVNTCLFFIRLICRVRAAKPTANLTDPLPLLNLWLQDRSLKPEQLSSMHLHRAFAYLTRPDKKYSDKELLEILESWLYYCQQPLDPNWREPDLEEKVRRLIHDLGPNFQALLGDPKNATLFFNELMQKCGIEDLTENTTSKWKEASFPEYCIQFSSTSYWKINILTGKIASETGILRLGNSSDLVRDNDYKRLFGDQRFPVRQSGKYLHFIHPRWGSIRLDPSNHLIIYRSLGQGKWAQYLSPHFMSSWQKDLPFSYLADQTHWMALDDSTSIEVIPLREASKKRGRIESNQITQKVDNEEQVVSPADHSAFKDFEEKSSIHYETGPESESIYLFRYRSLNGKTLRFNYERDALHLAENPAFILPEDQRLGLLGPNSNYLYLKDPESGQEKILVPMQPVHPSSSGAITRWQKLDTVDTHRKDEYTYSPFGKIGQPQKGAYRYIEFDVVQNGARDVITPSNQEGTLYLAYLYFIQRDYLKALQHLREISEAEALSPLSMKILYWLFAAGDQYADKTASNAAIKLHALLLLEKIKKRPDMHSRFSNEEEKELYQWKSSWVKRYRDALSTIPLAIQLSKEEEAAFVIGRYATSSSKGGGYDNELEISPFKALGYINDSYIRIAEKPLKDSVKYKDDEYSYKRALSGYEQNVSKYSVISCSYGSDRVSNGTPSSDFGYFYHRAKNAKDSSEALSIAVEFQLCFKKIDSEQQKDPLMDQNAIARGLIHFALLYPDKAPDVPNGLDSNNEDKLNWLKKACEARFNAQNTPSRFAKSLNPLKATPQTVETLSANRDFTPIFKLSESIQKQAVTKPTSPQRLEGPLSQQFSFFSYIGTFFNFTTPHTGDLKIDPKSIDIQEKDLPENERPYLNAIREEVKDFFQNELPKGIEENKERKDYSLKQESDLPTLKDNLIKGDGQFLGIEKTKEQLSRMREVILNLANKPSEEPSERFLQRILESGEALVSSDLEELINCWMTRNPSKFQTVNARLSLEECQQLDQLITLYLEYATALQQAKRALVLVEKIEKGRSEETETELAATLEAGWYFQKTSGNTLPIFDPQKDRILRTIEYRAGIRLRKQQVDLIQNLRKMHPTDKRFQHSISQMMMGGGKTSVVAAVLLIDVIMQLEEEDQPLETLPVFVGPTAQFETLKRNLSISQRTYFGQKVIPIALTRNEMTASNLQWVLDELKGAKKKSAVLLRPDTGPGLELEAFSLLHKLKHAEKDSNTSAIWNRVTLILEILTIIGYDTASLFDELDILFDPRVEMNFPDDPPTHIGDHYVELLHRLFKVMTDESILTSDKQSVAKLLDLRNPDRNFDESLFFQELLPPIALAFASYPDLLLKETHHKSFVRYVCGQMDPKKLTEEDVQFLEMMKERAKGSDEDLRLSADLIATTKYACRKISKSTMNHDVGKNFGRNITKSDSPEAEDDQMSVKVVYFEGTDSPTQNIPGNFFESIFYHFLTALCIAKEESLKNCGIHEEQVREFARQLRHSAEFYVDKYDEIFDETPEAKECLAITGIKLSQIFDEGNLKKATETINQDVDKILLVEAETIKNEVQYFPHYFGSNSQNLADLFSRRKGRGGSIRSMSGTPWNLPSYPSKLFENYLPDVGVEGQIAHVELLRAATNPHWLHETSDTSVKGVLDAALKDNPRAKEVRAIADSAYFFKKSDNLTVALQIQEYFKERDDIQTVLFFGRKKTDNPKEPKGRPDYLYMLKKGSRKPIFIGSTAKTELAKYGINPETCFVYYDDRHCEATDIPLKKTGVVIKTNSKKEIRRTRFQTDLRARGFFLKQDVETVVRKEERASFMNGGKTQLDLLLTSIKNQAIRKTDDAYSTLRKAIGAVSRNFVSQKIRKLRNDKRSLLEYFSAYEEILRTTTQVKPWEQFGPLEESTSAKVALEQYAKHHIAIFNKLNLNPDDREEIATQINQIVEEGSSSPYFPKEIFTSLSDQMETEQQVEFHQEVQVEVAKEVEVELQRELQQELQRYLELRANDAVQEFNWRDEDVVHADFPFSRDVKPLEEHMESCKHYEKPYHQIFKGCLTASSNFARSTNQNLPVFHPSQKPAHQILVIRTKEGLKLLLLSIHEADFFKDYLQRNAPQNMWLILSSGLEISSHEHADLEKEEQKVFDRGMLQVHFLNGNIQALNKNEYASAQFINEKDSDLKMRFLKIRVEKDKTQRHILYHSALLPSNEKVKTHLVVHSLRKEYESARNKDIANLTPSEVAMMKPHEVVFLSSKQIQYLTTRDQLQKIEPRMVKHVTADQVPLLPTNVLTELDKPEQIDRVDPDHYSLLTASQLKKLKKEKVPLVPDDRIKDLSFGQVPFVPKAKLKFLSMTQLQAVAKEQVPDLGDDQFKLLVTKEQVQEIPDNKLGFIDNKQVLLLSDKQIDELPVNFLPSLADDQLKLLKKEEQVQAIDVKRVQFLSDKVVQMLKDHQLPGASAGQIPLINLHQVKLLRKSQIPWVAPEQVKNVLDKRLQFLTKPAQVQALDPSRVQWVASAMAEHFTETQVPHATKEQVPHLKGEQLKQIVENQLPYLEKSQVPLIKDEFVAKLDIQQMLHVSSTQSLLLSEQQRMWTINPEAIKFVSNEKIPLIPNEGVKYLTADQVPYATKTQVPFLKETQVPFASEQQVPFLEGEQINWIKEEQLKFLTLPQVRYNYRFITKLSPQQVPGVVGRQVASLEPEQIQYLTTPEQVQEVEDKFVEHINQDAVKYLHDKQVPHVIPEQIPHLKDEHFKLLKRTKQIRAVPNAKVHLIKAKLVDKLSNEQVPYVTPSQVPHLEESQLKLLTKPEQIQAVDPLDLESLKKEQIPYLKDEQIKLLERTKQIRAVPNAKIHLIKAELLYKLSHEQLPYVTPSQVWHLEPEQLKLLAKPEQIEAVHPLDVQLLNEEQIQYLKTPEQVQEVEEKFVKHINQGAVKYLKDSQVPHVIPKQIPRLKDAHFKLLQTTKQIRVVPKEKTSLHKEKQDSNCLLS